MLLSEHHTCSASIRSALWFLKFDLMPNSICTSSIRNMGDASLTTEEAHFKQDTSELIRSRRVRGYGEAEAQSRTCRTWSRSVALRAAGMAYT